MEWSRRTRHNRGIFYKVPERRCRSLRTTTTSIIIAIKPGLTDICQAWLSYWDKIIIACICELM